MPNKLVYFQSRGRAEVIRLALAEAGVPWEDDAFQGTEAFAALKASGRLPFQAVPVWEEEGGLRLAQSLAILNHIARTHGLYGSSSREQAKIDEALGAVEDVRQELRKMFTCPADKRAETRQELLTKSLPRWFGMLEKLLVANGGGNGFIASEKISSADLALWYAMEMSRDNGFGAALADCPKLNAFFDRIAARPKIAAYLASPRRFALTKMPA